MPQVVVVEPIGFVRHAIASTLGDKGYTVHAGDCGHWALDFLVHNPKVSAVVVGERSKTLTGRDIYLGCRRLDHVNDEGVAQMPSFVMTVNVERGAECEHPSAREALDLGFAGVLAKPVDRVELADMMKRVTSAKPEPAALVAAPPSQAPLPPPESEVPSSSAAPPSERTELDGLRSQLASLQNEMNRVMEVIEALSTTAAAR